MSTAVSPYKLAVKYDGWLICLSFIVAMLGSYTCLQLVKQTRYSKSRIKSLLWICASGITLGSCAIWGLHFIGVLSVQVISFEREVIQTRYNLGLTIGTAFISSFACTIGLAISSMHLLIHPLGNLLERQHGSRVGNKVIDETSSTEPQEVPIHSHLFNFVKRRIAGDKHRPHILQILLAALFTATGVSIMHYIGMMAMSLQNVNMVYQPALVTLSVVIAYVASTTALFIAMNIEHEILQVVAAFIFACAISGMHYTSVGAVRYVLVVPTVSSRSITHVAMDPNRVTLIIIVASCSLCFMMTMIIANASSKARSKFERLIQDLHEEQSKTDQLLLNILPEHIADRMKQGEQYIYEEYESVSILFSDIVSFTPLASKASPKTLIFMLHELFSSFDAVCVSMKLEKIKTIGDAYLCCAGLKENEPDHAVRAVAFGLEMIRCVNEFNQVHFFKKKPFKRGDRSVRNMFQKPGSLAKIKLEEESSMHDIFFTDPSHALKIRVGVHTGKVVAGVIGTTKYVYDIFGDTVNVASRMESHGIPMKVQVSEETYLQAMDHYIFEKRPNLNVKGKGIQDVYITSEALPLESKIQSVEVNVEK